MTDDRLMLQTRWIGSDSTLQPALVQRHLRRVYGVWMICVMVAAALIGVSNAAGQLPDHFFAMDTGTRDATHQAPAQHVALAKEIGFAGVAPTYHNQAELQEWLAALGHSGLKMFALYMPLNLDNLASSMASLKEAARSLRDRDTMLWLTINAKDCKPSSTGEDEAAVKALCETAALAKDAG